MCIRDRLHISTQVGRNSHNQANLLRTQRRMLSWWRTMTSNAMQIPHTLPTATGSGSGANPVYSMSSPAAAIDEPATHRVRHSISPKTMSMPRPNHGKTASMAPKEVATPLPPRPVSYTHLRAHETVLDLV